MIVHRIWFNYYEVSYAPCAKVCSLVFIKPFSSQLFLLQENIRLGGLSCICFGGSGCVVGKGEANVEEDFNWI